MDVYQIDSRGKEIKDHRGQKVLDHSNCYYIVRKLQNQPGSWDGAIIDPNLFGFHNAPRFHFTGECWRDGKPLRFLGAGNLNSDALIVLNYAWDGNSYPSNELLNGWSQVSSSGDPAIGCATDSWLLQNPEVNPDYVCAKNTFWVDPNAPADEAPGHPSSTAVC